MPTLIETQEAVIRGLKEKVPGLKTCGAYRGEFSAEKKSFRSPAIFLALSRANPRPDNGTEQILVQTRWIAYVVVKSAKNEGLALAEMVMQAVHENRWGLKDTKPAEVETLRLMDAAGGGLTLWTVIWNQEIALGENVWDLEGIQVEDVLYSWVPKVGIPFEAEYLRM